MKEALAVRMRWLALIAVWTVLSGPVFNSTRAARPPNEPRASEAPAAATMPR